MRTILLGVLAAALPAGAALAQTYGLGVNAPSPDSVVVKIDGKNQTFTLGTGAAKPAAEAFLTCLVNDRVIKVERSHGATKLVMLDDSNVADLLREYLQSNTSMDPCAVGKAAYTPKPPALKSETPKAAVAAPAATQAAPAAAETKPAPKKKLGRKTAPPSAESSKVNAKVLGSSMPLPPPAATRPSNMGTDSAARATTLGTAPVERPTTAQTSPSLQPGSTAPGIQPSQAAPPVPTATTAPTLPQAPTQYQPPVAPPPPPTKP